MPNCTDFSVILVAKSTTFQVFFGAFCLAYLFLIERNYKEKEMLKRWKTILNKIIKFKVRSTLE
jgi:hypothetical protein